jgi:hypothetical protein
LLGFAGLAGPCSWYNFRMRISLLLILSALFALYPRKRRVDGKKRLLNVEEAVRLWADHTAVF